jgi:hypothetical protein
VERANPATVCVRVRASAASSRYGDEESIAHPKNAVALRNSTSALTEAP